MLLKLKKLRTSLGITQEQAGKALGVSEMHYMRKENQMHNRYGDIYEFKIGDIDKLYKLFMKVAKKRGRKLNINMLEILK